MATLPQLLPEDATKLDAILGVFHAHAEAHAVLLIDKGGFLIAHSGDDARFDLTTIAALSSGAFLANQSIAQLVGEPNFNSVYQQGENFSLLIHDVDENCLLVTIFPVHASAGAVKYFVTATAARIADQMKHAHARNPGAGYDLSVLNVADTELLFRKQV
jgi:predicted regulator of Ras-like GTPase activity (Roadblock/LC7/MglB family)